MRTPLVLLYSWQLLDRLKSIITPVKVQIKYRTLSTRNGCFQMQYSTVEATYQVCVGGVHPSYNLFYLLVRVQVNTVPYLLAIVAFKYNNLQYKLDSRLYSCRECSTICLSLPQFALVCPSLP